MKLAYAEKKEKNLDHTQLGIPRRIYKNEDLTIANLTTNVITTKSSKILEL